MTYNQVTFCSCIVNANFEISSKWFKIKCLFVSKYQNPKFTFCGLLIGKVRVLDSIDFS